MDNTKELWQIELELKTEKLGAAQKRYDESLDKIKTSEKRLTEAMKNEGRIQTTAKVTELRLQEAATKTALAKELQETKAKNTKELLDYKQTLAEKNRLAKETAAQIKAQQKLDSKFTGQSVELGSVAALTQQISHFRTLRDSVSTNSKEFGLYSQKVNELTAAKKQLTGVTGGLTSSVNKFGAGLISAIALQQAYNVALSSAKFQVMREAFVGGEKELQAFRTASANTVSDASLIALSNQASDLNINLKDQAILFAFAEEVADKYNTSTEEGFQKVFTIMQGGTKGLKDLGIVKSDFTKLTEQLAKEQGKEVDEQIRLQAIIALTNTTYEDAINKQMDMADVMETVTVQTKNVADEHGNFWDILSSMNPVVGFFNVGMEDMAKKETKAKDDAMLLIGELDTFNSKIPGWGAGTEDLRSYFISLAETFLTTANTAGMIQDALSGTSINRKAGDASIPLQGEGRVKKTRSGTSGTSGITKETETQLNLIKLQEEEYKKLETQLAKNLGDLGAERQIRLEMLNIEREIFRLRYGADITMKNLPDAKTLDDILMQESNIPGMTMRRGIKLPYINTPDMRPDMTSEEFKALMDAELAKGSAMLGYTESMWSNFQGMLADTGLMEGSFGQIVNMINSLISGGKSAFGFFDAIGGLLGFLPGGGVVSSVIGGLSGGGGGMAGMPNYPMPQNQPLVAPVIIKNPISLGKGLEIENRYNDVRGSIDI